MTAIFYVVTAMAAGIVGFVLGRWWGKDVEQKEVGRYMSRPPSDDKTVELP
jgi:hypothetical protein